MKSCVGLVDALCDACKEIRVSEMDCDTSKELTVSVHLWKVLCYTV